MTASERRQEMLKLIRSQHTPITGGDLARRFSISRQVVVQDVALLRAGGHPILATPDGYVYPRAPLFKPARRSFLIRHKAEDARDELMTIVQHGGTVVDVSVVHAMYGELRAMMMLTNEASVHQWVDRMSAADAPALEVLTKELHRHTVEADSQATLNVIEEALRAKGYLAKDEGGAVDMPHGVPIDMPMEGESV